MIEEEIETMIEEIEIEDKEEIEIKNMKEEIKEEADPTVEMTEERKIEMKIIDVHNLEIYKLLFQHIMN